jgi:hypothetical protein
LNRLSANHKALLPQLLSVRWYAGRKITSEETIIAFRIRLEAVMPTKIPSQINHPQKGNGDIGYNTGYRQLNNTFIDASV